VMLVEAVSSRWFWVGVPFHEVVRCSVWPFKLAIGLSISS
jgi:hypothetical protein